MPGNADAGLPHDFAFYIRHLTGIITGSDLTDPDAATIPKWHTARHLTEKKGIIAADPIWDVPFHACAITGGTLMTEMRLPPMGSLNAVDSPGRTMKQGIGSGGVAMVCVRADMDEGKKW